MKSETPASAAEKAPVHFPLTALQITLLRSSFSQIEPQAGIAAIIFYRNLFTLNPALRSLFHTSIELQGRKLMESLKYTVSALEEPEKLVPQLEAMGRRHVTYGTRNEHYATVAQAMLQMMRECLREKFTPDVETAWELALTFVAEAMQRGAARMQELTDDEKTAAR